MISAHAFVHNVLLVLALLLASPSLSSGQSEKCSDRDLLAVLKSTDKSYSIAMELAQTLEAGDFAIRCVLRSKQETLFEGLQGAALFRTNRGDFEAMFLPKQKTFESLKIVKRRENGWYIYSFEGEPRPWPANRIESPRRLYFVKHSNILLETSNDVLSEDLHRTVSGNLGQDYLNSHPWRLVEPCILLLVGQPLRSGRAARRDSAAPPLQSSVHSSKLK